MARAAVAVALAVQAKAADLNSTYQWNPVRIGAGGFVTGFVSHPLDPDIRYCRTDVGNAYRWDNTAQEWMPMIVRNADGTGLPADVAAVPGITGCSSIAVDPSNTNIVLMAFPVRRSDDLKATFPSLYENVYRSTDGGRTFTKGNLAVIGAPNGSWRCNGERLKVDPNNGNIIYYCTGTAGLYRSTDAGATWGAVTAGGAPTAAATPINIHFDKNGGTTSAFGQTVSSVVYVVGGDTDVYRSSDGGQNWTNITTGTLLSGHTTNSTLDQNGALWVPLRQNPNGNKLWKFTGTWTTYTVATNASYGYLTSVAVDPTNANRLFAITSGCSVSRSVNGGASWTNLGTFKFANTFGWLPQPVGWRSSGGIFFDANGELWVPQGNEGILRYVPTYSETSINWTIQSKGIEEMVAQDIIIPKGGGDHAVTATEDTTAHYINDPSQFTAVHSTLAPQLLSASNGISTCPNATNYLAIASSDIFNTSSGNNFSGYSNDGGLTWTQFASNPKALQAGSIAVSYRGAWGLGSDRIVMLPYNNRPPYYSHDGGATWTPTASFALTSGTTMVTQIGWWNAALKQRQLKADPFVPGKFYLNFISNGTLSTFHTSSDSGVTWSIVPNAGLPRYAHAGNLEVNYAVQEDLWFVDGFQGTGTTSTPHGLYHSAPGTGNVFTKVPGVQYAWNLALGKGRGQPGDAAYTVFFYGKLASDPAWGIFRSVDAGTTWDRISYYPAGIFDTPTCMAASWDTFGLVYVGFMGNSYVYGKPQSPHIAFTQNFNAGTSISTFTGTTVNLFNTVSQGTAGGGYSITANKELLITRGTDTTNLPLLASGGNLSASLQSGCIIKGTVRAAANPNNYSSRIPVYLQVGTGATLASNLGVYINVGGTAAAPAVSMQPQSQTATNSVSSSTGTPFWLVINKSGSPITYIRPDGISQTLNTSKYDLWFGPDGNSGAVTNKWLAYPTNVLDSFWFLIPSSQSANGCAVAIDDLKVGAIGIGTTQF